MKGMSLRAKWGAVIATGGVLIGLLVGLWLLSSTVNRIPVDPDPVVGDNARLEWKDERPMISFETEVGERNIETTEDYFRRIWHERESMAFWQKFVMKLFNVSGPGSMVFVGLGLLGQLLFAGRLVVQWLATERSRRSVVPTAFWWMAIGGASLLVVYFVWRKDIVGVLGQSTGWIIYMRNLYFIYFKGGGEPEAAESPAPVDEPAGRGRA